MNYDKEKVTEFIHDISFHANPLYSDGPYENYKKWKELSDKDQFEDEQVFIKEHFYSISDYYFKIYFRDVDYRMFDEILESTSIFFSRLHGCTLPIIHVSKEVEAEGYGMGLFDKAWDGYNWEYLVESSTDPELADKTLFRNIAKDFMANCLGIVFPSPVDKFDIE